MTDYFSDRVSKLSGSAIRATFKLLSQPGIISFAGGMPAPEMFPTAELAAIAEEILTNKGAIALQYGITEGYAPLLEQVRQTLSSQNIARPDDDIMIVSGGQQGIGLAAKIFLNEGDGIVCESPSFIGALNAFRSFGAKLYGVNVQHDGMDMDMLEQTLANNKIKAIYTIPTFQNPTGITMSLDKRKKLLDLAARYDAVIIEDNPYGELRFAGESLPTLKELDKNGAVVYVGSFSKILSPGLRVGFVCAKAQWTQKMAVCKQVEDVHTSVLPQMMISEYLSRHNINEHISKLNKLYGERCAFMKKCARQYFPDDIEATNPQGGLFLWCESKSNAFDSTKLAAQALEQKVAFVAGASLMPQDGAITSAFRLNYSTCDEEKINEGMRRLGEVIQK